MKDISALHRSRFAGRGLLVVLMAILAVAFLSPGRLVADTSPESGDAVAPGGVHGDDHGEGHDEAYDQYGGGHDSGYSSAHDGLHHRHHLAVFIGLTRLEHESHGQTVSLEEETFGIDYEYRLGKNGRFGTGVLVDYAGGELDATVVAVPVFLHAGRNWKFVLAPGVAFHQGETLFLVRAGLSYDIHIGSTTVAPSYAIDFVDNEEVHVFGLMFGFGF